MELSSKTNFQAIIFPRTVITAFLANEMSENRTDNRVYISICERCKNKKNFKICQRVVLKCQLSFFSKTDILNIFQTDRIWTKQKKDIFILIIKNIIFNFQLSIISNHIRHHISKCRLVSFVRRWS